MQDHASKEIPADHAIGTKTLIGVGFIVKKYDGFPVVKTQLADGGILNQYLFKDPLPFRSIRNRDGVRNRQVALLLQRFGDHEEPAGIQYKTMGLPVNFHRYDNRIFDHFEGDFPGV